MIDEKAKSTVANALYEAMEGPVSNQDFARQQRQWESAQALAVVAIEAYESAKPKDAEGLKLGSRLTVEGVEAVVVDVDLIERSQHQPAASPFPFDRCVGAEISAMLSAAGDKE